MERVQVTPGTGERVRQVLLIAILLACAAGVLLPQGTPKQQVLNVGFLGSAEDEDTLGALAFKALVEARSEGRIKVNVYPSGQFCGNERECLEHLQRGILDVHMTTFGGMGRFYPAGTVFDLPYLYRDDAVAECIFAGPIQERLRAAVLSADVGVRLMTISNTGGWRNFATTRRPIRGLADLDGLKIRTIPSPLQQEMVRLLGGNPTPIAWSELYTALATGVVSGTKNGVQDIIGMNFQESIRYLTIDRHAYMGALWWFSEARWQALSPADRALVREGMARLREVTLAVPKEREADAYAAFRAAGGEVLTLGEEARRDFQQAVAPLRAWYAAQHGERWLGALDAAISECESAVVPTASARTGRGARAAPSPG